MARENATEESNDSTDPGDASGFRVRCPNCEARLTAGRPEAPCPECDTAFFVRVYDEFALVERDGWTVSVSLGAPTRPGVLVDG
ncbi:MULTISPECIES: hypothetical protein [Halorussus]|uniref:hypothetical protein n=1 Tax=Halorussus TaxID=1070314 RepID=UPI000E21353D|nr:MULTISPECIES: hypothetical protein [Halorussus]NHN58129.1 hypothetical protein [Halorussus sp. JP-T4]